MLRSKVFIAALIVLATMALSEPSLSVAPIGQSIDITANIPEEITLTLEEADEGISLSPIYPGPGTGEGSISVLSTGPWILTAKDGTEGGDGRMRSSKGHVLFKKHEIKAGGRYVNLAPNTGFNLLKILPPGSYTFATGYRQAFTAGDYAGDDYSIAVLWECSAAFE